MKPPKETMTGAMLTPEYREKLARVLNSNGRTFRAQLEQWIEMELRFIARNA